MPSLTNIHIRSFRPVHASVDTLPTAATASYWQFSYATTELAVMKKKKKKKKDRTLSKILRMWLSDYLVIC